MYPLSPALSRHPLLPTLDVQPLSPALGVQSLIYEFAATHPPGLSVSAGLMLLVFDY